MNPTEVSFYSDSHRITGYLFTPEDWKTGDPPRPGIIVLAGYSGNTQADCTHMMKRLCAEGWFTFGFDQVGFGKSEGKRNRHRPFDQVQNTFDGLTYLQTIPGIDPERLGIFGPSFGCASGIWVAAHDERVKCLVTDVGVTNGETWMRSLRRPWEWLAFKERVAKEARERVVTGQSTMMPYGEIMLRDPETQRQRDRQVKAGHVFQSEERDVESAETTMRFRPDWVVDKISPRPVLFIYAEYDVIVPSEQQLTCYEKCGEPKKLVKLPKANHYDSYEFGNPETNKLTSEISYTETINWFSRYL